MTDTVLTLSGIGIVPFSSRAISETLAPIDQGAQLRRSVNGTLTDLSLTAFRKYRVSLGGSDMQPIALNGVWKGQAVTVGCVTEIAKAITLVAGAATVQLDRPFVAGSGRAVRANGESIQFTADVDLATVTGPAYEAQIDFNDPLLSGEAFVIYRPLLACLVTGFSSARREYDATQDWTLELEEV